MQALFNGGLLWEGSMAEMLDRYLPRPQDTMGFQTGFGLGIFKVVISVGPVYLHSGDAIGYFAAMAYFPEHRLSVSWAVNANYGSVMGHSQSKAAMERIFETVLRWIPQGPKEQASSFSRGWPPFGLPCPAGLGKGQRSVGHM